MRIGNVEHKERKNNKTAMRVYFIRIENAEHKERINNETAMRFVGCAPIFPPHFPRLYMENAVSM